MKVLVVSFCFLSVAHGFLLRDKQDLSPVQVVVKLLENMSKELDAEAESDQAMYDKLKCWCKTNKEEKTASIAKAESDIGNYESEVEESAGKNGALEAEIDHAEKQLKESNKSYLEMRSIREKEQAKFEDDEKESLVAITNLKNAVNVLSKHHSGLLQMTPSLTQSLGAVLRSAADRQKLAGKDHSQEMLLALQSSSLSKMDHKFLRAMEGHSNSVVPEKFAAQLLASFAQEGQPVAAKSYNSQSGEIFGVLKQMLDEFESDLKGLRENNENSAKEFAQVEATKKAEMGTLEKALEAKKSEKANNLSSKADAEENLEESREQLSNDKKFLDNVTIQCRDIDHQWDLRSANRADEKAAVSEAITILTSDDNREALVKASFVQTSSSILRRRDVQVSKNDSDDLEQMWTNRDAPIDAAAQKQKLSALAMSTSLDSFTKVKQAMDKMVAELKKQQQDEVAKRDECNKNFKNNRVNTTKTQNELDDVNNNIADLQGQITQLNEDITTLKSEVNTLQIEIKKAGENRESENADFQKIITEQRASQEILTKALRRLEVFYKKKTEASLIETEIHQEPPVKFDSYKGNSGANPVLSMITKIIADSKKTESEAIDDEHESQANYETFVADSNASMKAAGASIVTKTSRRAQAEADVAAAEGDRDEKNAKLGLLAQEKADLHQVCDFVLKNFEVRQESRNQEMESIRQAKAILSGSQ